MRRLVSAAAAAASLAAPPLAHAAVVPTIARPNPVTYPVRLDYIEPLVGTDGKTASLEPLGQGVIMAATRDATQLRYSSSGDLGGFARAVVGAAALQSGGREVVPSIAIKPQVPLFARAGDGAVLSYTFTHAPTGATPPPDNGHVPGVAPPPPPTLGNVAPPANQGFGGRPSGERRGGPTTTTRGRGGGGGAAGGPSTTTTTTTPPPPTTVTTTAPTTTGGGGGSGGGSGGGGSGCSGGSCAPGPCGVAGISVNSNIPGCTLTLSTASPGDSVSETFTIQNTSGSPYTLSFMAGGLNNNHLWQDLEMDVYDPVGGVPTPPLPPLTSWLGSFHGLTTLTPGQTVQYVVVLYLPTTASNADMGQSAVINFTWSAS
ncbi:MAG TPA: hypothetical protein VKR23_11380 [Gaiellaceae bacterium]|nr:hypothetical protein [Gaiellaceae bacterium]